MLIYFVFIVFMNILMTKTEDNIIKIGINKMPERICNVTQEVKLLQNSNFTLQIESEYFIVNGTWTRVYNSHFNIDRLQSFKHSNLSITYERSIGSTMQETKNTFKFTYSHFFIQSQQPQIVPGPWHFTFELLRNYDPWSFEELSKMFVERWECSTSVKIYKRERSVPNHSANHGGDKPDGWSGSSLGDSHDVDKKCLIIVLAIIGALLLAQTSYIITDKIRGRKSNKNNDKDPITPKSPKVKRGLKPERNIADRPPLPLPPDDVTKDEPGSPVPLSPMSPRPKRHHHLPLKQKETQRNKCLDTSEQGVTRPSCALRYLDGPLVPKQSYTPSLPNPNEKIRSPGCGRRHETRKEGPLVSKQSYRNEALKISDEELRSPGLGRKHEAPLVPRKPHKNKALENSLEELRTPDVGRRRKGPLVPKQSYRNNVLDDSDEEIGTPSFARRQIEAELVQSLPKGVSPSKSFKNPIPLPRRTSSPPTPPEKTSIFAAPSKEPAPPLHSKKVAAIIPTQQETVPSQDSRRFSDDEWQYEQLQPASKYLNTNFTDDKSYIY